MYTVIDLKWMLECGVPSRKLNHLCGKHLTVVLLRSVGMFDFSMQIHCRTPHDKVDIEWHHDVANRPTLLEQ